MIMPRMLLSGAYTCSLVKHSFYDFCNVVHKNMFAKCKRGLKKIKE